MAFKLLVLISKGPSTREMVHSTVVDFDSKEEADTAYKILTVYDGPMRHIDVIKLYSHIDKQ